MGAVCALLPTGAGPLLTSSTDAGIRLWDGARPEGSYMVCGPPTVASSPAPAGAVGSQPVLSDASGSPPVMRGSGVSQHAVKPTQSRQGPAGAGQEQATAVAYVYGARRAGPGGVPVIEESCIARGGEYDNMSKVCMSL